MDRRQKKTREAIFSAFTSLLSEKTLDQITVSDIIERADVGRATFYAHFETKDFLLKELCEDLFCHIFDATEEHPCNHQHIFQCDAPDSVFLHLFQHVLRNDHGILQLLSGQNHHLFSQYFQDGLRKTILSQLPLFAHRKDPRLPDSFWIDHIAAVFVQTLRWWIHNNMSDSPETITEFFLLAV